MIKDDGLTIREYLSQQGSSGTTSDPSVSSAMCELLTTSFDFGSCEGAAQPVDMCSVETSMTFDRHALDWAYQESLKLIH